jgi:hypothetical protein
MSHICYIPCLVIRKMICCLIFVHNKNWEKAMAVNVLGSVTATRTDSGAWCFPAITCYDSSVEPLAFDTLFKHGQIDQLHHFQTVGPSAINLNAEWSHVCFELVFVCLQRCVIVCYVILKVIARLRRVAPSIWRLLRTPCRLKPHCKMWLICSSLSPP